MTPPPLPFLADTASAVLSAFAEAVNLPRFRLKQIGEWVNRRFTTNPDAMNNLPSALRLQLKEAFICDAAAEIGRTAAKDGTMKLLLRLYDGNTIEAVMIPAPERMTFCLSSQVGCPVRCRFCASGSDGLVRNLSAGEILDQFFTLCRVHGKLPTNVVFMGIGEPLLNFEAVSAAIGQMTDLDAIGFSPRRITVSTSGITEGIYRLAELDKPLYLALSLHAVDDETRARIIPDAFRHPLSEILPACEDFASRHNRLITLEYTLLKGVNDSDSAARELAQIALRLRAKVNLIPFNPVPAARFERPPEAVIRRFASVVERAGANITVRLSKGEPALAACGQLRKGTTLIPAHNPEKKDGI